MRLTSQRPDPAHFWVRGTPRPWTGPDAPWVDLAGGSLGRPGRSQPSELPLLEGTPPEDLLYLPPVAEPLREARDRLARETLEGGVPVLAQFPPGQTGPPEGCRLVVDLSGHLLAGQNLRLPGLPAEVTAVWPLISGLTDGPERIRAGLEELAASGIDGVQGVALELTPADRRRLAELGGEDTFHRLFHGERPSERQFAAVAAAFGFKPFGERPLPAEWRPERGNRRLAGELALIAELWLRVGRPEAAGQAFYRASRWVDREPHDLERLCREGNLGVVSWLDRDSRRVLTELVSDGDSSLRRELESRYLGLQPERPPETGAPPAESPDS